MRYLAKFYQYIIKCRGDNKIIRVRNGRAKIYIGSLRGVYGSAKDDIQVVKRLYIVGGKIFYGGEKL